MADGAWRQRHGLRHRPTEALPHLLLLVPLLAAILFVRRYSIAFPLTDEWLFVRGAISLQSVDPFTSNGLADTLSRIPMRLSEHWVVVPFLVYYPIASWTHFDSRWFMYITVAVFALEALLYRRYLVTSSLGALPIVLLLFSPSHYMEFMWGWQLTL